MAEKRSRLSLTIKEKREICAFSTKWPGKSQQDIADHFSTVWKKQIKRRTVCDILLQKNWWMALNLSDSRLSTKKMRPPKHDAMEKAVFLWLTSARANNCPITQDILKSKAMEFGAKLNITDFNYSSGWLTRFKQRFEISYNHSSISGESADVDMTAVQTGIGKARRIISQYSPQDVFNMDETGLFYQMLPDRSLTTSEFVRGTKKIKDRISLALCANADGSEKSRLLIIGKSKRPRCLKHFRVELYADYKFHKKAWMTSLIFSEWLQEFNKKMKRQCRKVLLLLDNAPSHVVSQTENENSATPHCLSNVEIHFLSPGAASHIQPMSAGVIQAFKCHYRRQQMQHMVDAIDGNRPPRVTLNDAIRFAKCAWDCVTPEVIGNCYRHTRILPLNWNGHGHNQVQPASPSTEQPATSAAIPSNLFERIAVAFNMDSSVLMNETEFSNVDNHLECCSVLEDDGIIDLVQATDQDDNDSDATEMEESELRTNVVSTPSASDARQATQTLLQYFEANAYATGKDIDLVNKLRFRLDSFALTSSRQAAITEFFAKQ